MSVAGVTMTMRVTRTANRTGWRASIEELEISAVGRTSTDALYTLGQLLSAVAESCKSDNKDVLDLVSLQGG